MSIPTTSASSTASSISTWQSNEDRTSVRPPPNGVVILTPVDVSHLESDLRMLETGTFSDFTIIRGSKEWKIHQVILNRCPYFARAISEQSAFKETLESKIPMEGLEEYEISWLLQYIYGLRIDIEVAKGEGPNKSFLETCVLLWRIGDCFCFDSLDTYAANELGIRCSKIHVRALQVSSVINDIDFLPDLEAGIRSAWRQDRVPFQRAQADFTLVCLVIYPYLRDTQPFTALLDELPQFSTHLLKALLGCWGDFSGTRLRTNLSNPEAHVQYAIKTSPGSSLVRLQRSSSIGLLYPVQSRLLIQDYSPAPEIATIP